MKYEKIDPASRIWIVSRGPDGKLQEEIDPALLEALRSGQSAEDIADALIVAAGRMDIAETRLW